MANIIMSKQIFGKLIIISCLSVLFVACGQSPEERITNSIVADGKIGSASARCIAKAIVNSDEISEEAKNLMADGKQKEIPEEDKPKVMGIFFQNMGNTDC